jgi:hypothetical protein
MLKFETRVDHQTHQKPLSNLAEISLPLEMLKIKDGRS